MNGNEIVIASPHGRKIEGIIYGTPKPGTFMQVRNTAQIGGRNTFEPYAPGTGDGSPRPLFILDIDSYQGKTFSDAYVSGTRGFLWAVLPGDEVNARKADISGTGSGTEDISIGERLLLVDGTGKASPIAVGIANSLAVYPLTALEAITDQPEETLVHCIIGGGV